MGRTGFFRDDALVADKAPGSGGGRDEPQLMVREYGRGRVFHTTFGHDVRALSSVDFAVTLQRGTEWAATGDFTQAVPASCRRPTRRAIATLGR